MSVGRQSENGRKLKYQDFNYRGEHAVEDFKGAGVPEGGQNAAGKTRILIRGCAKAEG